MVKVGQKIDNLAFKAYDKLMSRPNDKWTRKVQLFFRRLAYVFVTGHWENNASLGKHLLKELTTRSSLDDVMIRKTNALFLRLHLNSNSKTYKALWEKLKPLTEPPESKSKEPPKKASTLPAASPPSNKSVKAKQKTTPANKPLGTKKEPAPKSDAKTEETNKMAGTTDGTAPRNVNIETKIRTPRAIQRRGFTCYMIALANLFFSNSLARKILMQDLVISPDQNEQKNKERVQKTLIALMEGWDRGENPVLLADKMEKVLRAVQILNLEIDAAAPLYILDENRVSSNQNDPFDVLRSIFYLSKQFGIIKTRLGNKQCLLGLPISGKGAKKLQELINEMENSSPLRPISQEEIEGEKELVTKLMHETYKQDSSEDYISSRSKTNNNWGLRLLEPVVAYGVSIERYRPKKRKLLQEQLKLKREGKIPEVTIDPDDKVLKSVIVKVVGEQCDNGIKKLEENRKQINHPENIFVRFKRFNIEGRNSGKNNSPITIPDNRIVTFFGRKYEVVGAAIHHGTSLDSGHYTYVGLAEKDGETSIDPTWYSINDSLKKELTKKQAIKGMGGAYLMLLRRVD